MVAAAEVAAGVGKLADAEALRIRETTLAVGKLPPLNVKPKSILRRLQSDKKTRNGRVHFVLPTEIGKVEIVSDVPEGVVLGAVEEIRELSQG
jgi:3-dehydroquinate synthetase